MACCNSRDADRLRYNRQGIAMEDMSTWEMVLVGALVVLVLFWVGPGIKPMLEQSRQAEKDWTGLLVPLLAVLLFVILLISMV